MNNLTPSKRRKVMHLTREFTEQGLSLVEAREKALNRIKFEESAGRNRVSTIARKALYIG